MRVFISWSGEQSREAANALRDWLPDVIQVIEPWLSSKDMPLGTRWASSIMEALTQADIGIICLTQENLNSPWLMYEAGALSKLVGNSLVCIYLLDLSPSDITGPLAQFQNIVAEKDDTYKLICELNRIAGDSGVSDDRLRRAFDSSWPLFEHRLSDILNIRKEKPLPRRSLDDEVDEILTTVRELRLIILDKESQSIPQKAPISPGNMESPSKPRIFIGSSSEGLPVAEAIQLGLETVTECTIWNQAAFDIARTPIESIVEISHEYDFAAVVLTPDDILVKRGKTGAAPRDNLLFELGLFTGSLGRARTFMVYCMDEELSLPTDLSGVTAAVYARRSDGNIQAALGPVCTRIKRAMGV